ncbi:MAG: CDP-diacylglycerol--glycerol-3-phosphate 3-phosphatidyltransferase [Pseudomonadota bacterium]
MANFLTIGRILLIIPFVLAFTTNASWNLKAAFVIFAIASLTDLADGWVARTRGEVSVLGAALDPLADKLLAVAALVLLMRNGVIRDASVLAALIIILRELLVSGLREAVALAGGKLKVTGLAKWKTAVQLIAIGLLLAAAPTGFIGLSALDWGLAALWVAALLTFWTGADYAVKSYRFLRAQPAPKD